MKITSAVFIIRLQELEICMGQNFQAWTLTDTNDTARFETQVRPFIYSQFVTWPGPTQFLKKRPHIS